MMQDKDKLILVCYVGDEAMKAFGKHKMIRLAQVLKSYFDESVKTLVIADPSTPGIRMEVLNVKDCQQEKLEELQKTYDKVLEKLEKESQQFLT